MTGEKEERSERREKEHDCPGRRTEPGTLGNGPDSSVGLHVRPPAVVPGLPLALLLTIFTCCSSPSILQSIFFFLFQCSSRPAT